MPTVVQWTKAEGSHGVPLWIIILAILIGLLLLGLLIYILYKVSHILPVTWLPSHQVLPLTQHNPKHLQTNSLATCPHLWPGHVHPILTLPIGSFPSFYSPYLRKSLLNQPVKFAYTCNISVTHRWQIYGICAVTSSKDPWQLSLIDHTLAVPSESSSRGSQYQAVRLGT